MWKKWSAVNTFRMHCTSPKPFNRTSPRYAICKKRPIRTKPHRKRHLRIHYNPVCRNFHMQGYSVDRNDGFPTLINILEPWYVLPTRRHLSEVAVPNPYAYVNHNVATSIKSAEKIAQTRDSWTSRPTDSYLANTSRFITDDWRLASRVF